MRGCARLVDLSCGLSQGYAANTVCRSRVEKPTAASAAKYWRGDANWSSPTTPRSDHAAAHIRHNVAPVAGADAPITMTAAINQRHQQLKRGLQQLEQRPKDTFFS